MFRRIMAEEPRAVAVDHGTGGDHLGIDQRAAREQAVEEPAMPVGPLHHGGDGESVCSVFQRSLLASRPLTPSPEQQRTSAKTASVRRNRDRFQLHYQTVGAG